MSLDSLLESLSYYYCPKPNHREELSLVCTHKKCLHALICGVCEKEDHNEHKTIPLKKFLKEISLVDDQTVIRMALNLQSDLATIQERFRSGLAKTKQEFMQSTYELETRFNSYFSNLSDKYYQTFQKKSHNFVIKAISSAIHSTNIQGFASLIDELKLHNQVSLNDQINYFRRSTQSKLRLFTEAINKLNFKEELKKLNNILVVAAQPFNTFNYQWSNFKAPSILVNGSLATQKAGSSCAERFILAQSKLEGSGDIKVQFRISRLKGWVGIGICLKQKIIKAGYRFNYTLPEHGSYLISANGYSWSHSRPQYNSAFKSFVFHEGDTISVEYSVLERKVSFESKLTGSKFYLSTVDCPADDCYLPCANLFNTGDEVEIINELS